MGVAFFIFEENLRRTVSGREGRGRGLGGVEFKEICRDVMYERRVNEKKKRKYH